MIDVLWDEQLYAFTGGCLPSIGELRLRYQRLAAGHPADGHQTWLNWVVRFREGNVSVGTVQATVEKTGAQIAWVVGVQWQRQGFATEAAIALVGWLEQRSICTMSANIHPRHAASQGVASRAGLVLTDDVLDDGGCQQTRPLE